MTSRNIYAQQEYSWPAGIFMTSGNILNRQEYYGQQECFGQQEYYNQQECYNSRNIILSTILFSLGIFVGLAGIFINFAGIFINSHKYLFMYLKYVIHILVGRYFDSC
jgi:hypothetical protein